MAEAEERKSRPSPGMYLGRMLAAAQNGLEIARFGGLGEREPSPYAVIAKGAHHKVRRYFPDAEVGDRPPAVLVPPLMMSAEVWDVSPDTSAVAALHRSGVSPFVVDFGSPEVEEGGLDRTLTDHVIAVSEAVDAVREATGRDVHLMGYSQGGMFCYQATAYRHAALEGESGVASLVTFGSPVDMHRALPIEIPVDLLAPMLEGIGRVQSALFPSGIPSWATRLGFQLMDPVNTVRQRIDFARQLWDRETLLQREGMRRFLESEAWVAFPGPALLDVVRQLVAHNRMLQGGFVIDDHTVTLASIDCPILTFTGKTDSIAPAVTVRAIYKAAPRAEAYEVSLRAGHFGLVVGSRSAEITWPTVAGWLEWCEGVGPRPSNMVRLEPREKRRDEVPTPLGRLAEGAGLAWDLGRELIDDVAGFASSRVGVLGRISGAIAPQLPRLGRLDELRRDTSVSPGKILEEHAANAPDDTFFLFEGRAHSYRAANVRVDNVVRGLLHCGVRHGEHVGVLMHTRPSAVAATMALSRIGAVAVLLRPDVDLSAQLELVPVRHLVADPEHGPAAREIFGPGVLVLGGGGGARELAEGLLDMESIDPDAVEPPGWYTPDPGLAGELGMVLITGDGDRLGANRVTNRRFATSAYGTATACALTSGDTVYCCSPTYHATGILVCVGGALAGGARLAMTTPSGSGFDVERFWEDVRRYGVSVVCYTGAMLRFLVNSPDDPGEHHHPIRLFAGSGMPKGVWKRVAERFHPARVVEFYASTEGNSVLVNLTGRKAGSVGRPLPGGSHLAIAAYDLAEARLLLDEDGFATRCPSGEIGLLLGGLDLSRGEVEGRALRGVFEPRDAWVETGELARVDRDGDYWLAGSVADVVHAPAGALPSGPVEDLLTAELEFVDLAAVYGASFGEDGAEILVAAITLRREAKLDAAALRSKVTGRLPEPRQPLVVRVLEELPLTAGQRIRRSALRREGLGLESGAGETLWLAPDADAYVPFGREDLPGLLAMARR
jgi:putative long chain acyl-CoA synthase